MGGRAGCSEYKMTDRQQPERACTTFGKPSRSLVAGTPSGFSGHRARIDMVVRERPKHLCSASTCQVGDYRGDIPRVR
jgi:hypothetical protein